MPPSSDCANGAARCTAMGKTAEERFHTLARGWLAYPVTPTHHPSTAEERLYKRDPGIAPTARCTAIGENRRRAVSYVSTGLACLPRDAGMHAHLPPKSGCISAIPVCARGALLLVTPSARRDSGGRMGHRRGHHLYALRRCATSPSRRGVPSLKKPPPNGLPTPWL